jgi:DNA-directed RNA polymerase subunit RPC12/RpoP
MNVTYACSHCQAINRYEVGPETKQLTCAACGTEIKPPADAWEGQHLKRCLVCPNTDLFVRKAFPQRLGVAIVILGFVLSCIAWYDYRTELTFGILFATALIDVVLYVVVGNLLMCYRCQAQYRGVEGIEQHGGFELDTHERHRQQLARLAEHEKRQQPLSQS